MSQQLNPKQDVQQFLAAHIGRSVCQFNTSTDNVSLQCEFTTIEQLGCSFQELVCRLESEPFLTEDQIENISDRLCRTLSYLQEPIRRIEFDKAERFAMLRSDPPEREEESRRYYELNVSSNQIHLCRFEKTPENRQRQKISCVVTQQVMGRLVSDMMTSLL